MNQIKGKIIKGIGGFYYVNTAEGVIECKARGLFRNKSVMPYVGDNVELEISEDGTGYIKKIEKRKNFFIRPPISNVDVLIIVVALANPSPDLMFLDKMLIQAEYAAVPCVIVFNKCDLLDTNAPNPYEKIYSDLGYRVFTVSTLNGHGMQELKSIIDGKVISVCGFSGVGKSSILNCLLETDTQEVGEISKKLARGKHTTREVSLIEYKEGSYLADTPGFSSLAIPDEITKDTLKSYFIEFSNFDSECKFSDCVHTSPKFCAVCNAVSEGEIHESRYKNYINLYEQLKDKKEWK